MKIVSLFLLVALMMLIGCTSKDTVDAKKTFDKTLLTGTWLEGTDHYKYFADGTGSSWDTADNVLESEAQKLEWTLVDATLTHIHYSVGVAQVPKTYTVTELTATSLKYQDSFGVKHVFVKI